MENIYTSKTNCYFGMEKRKSKSAIEKESKRAEYTHAISSLEYKRNVEKHKIGRNSLCPCGSGKKYKNCCYNKEEL